MMPEDRDLLQSLRRQQVELQQALERLNAQLNALESRAGASLPEIPHHASPLPPVPLEMPELALPPLPEFAVAEQIPAPLPPMPVELASHALPPLPPIPPPPQPSFEFQFGRWLTRIGALFLVLSLVFFATWVDVTYHIHERLGAVGKLGIMGLVGALATALGQRLERKMTNVLFFGRTLMAAGLAGLYVTIYSAYYSDTLRVIHSPLFAGLLLLIWSIYVLLLAERRKSQTLGLFSIILAYVSTAINPVGMFTMGADLILAATAVVFLLRNGWAVLSTFSMVGTYLALLRRLVVDENGELVFDTSRTLPFWPHAIYLIFAWLIFTAAVVLTSAPSFRGAKRLAFLSLNNGALAGLLALTAYIAGYGDSAIGWTLIDTGFVFLVMSRFAGFAEIDPVDVMGAYAAQGLALVTGGIIVVYTGITRGVLLLIETFFLGIAAAFSGDRILTVSTYVSAFFATLFLIWEIAVNAHHPWLLGFSGALVMLINAWSCRGEIRHSPLARSTIVISSSCFCIMAIGLIFTALNTELSENALPPALAIAALALTFVIYQFSIFELPPLAQILLIAAQAYVLFPPETGEELPWWTTAWVAAITLLLVTWWSRQRVTRSGSWTISLCFLYAFALADMAHLEIRPYLDAQGWMIGASLLSVVFLIYGAFVRVWSVAAAGQVVLVLALYHFFFPPQHDIFPWTWWAAAVPVMVVFATARAAHEWLAQFSDFHEAWRRPFHLLAYGYLILALIGLVRWIFGVDVIPESEHISAFLFFGTLILSNSVRHESAFGVRCSFLLTATGMWLYFDDFATSAHAMATFLNGLAMLLLLSQPALLRHEGKSLVTRLETWILIILATATSWAFVSAWVWTRLTPGYLTMGWALDALFLFIFGLLVREPRLRWCGMAVVAAAILRVLCYDMWSFSLGYKLLTLIVLTFITFGIGYGILRRSASESGNSHGTP